MHKVYTENITEHFMHAQMVSTRLLLGGEGPEDKARGKPE